MITIPFQPMGLGGKNRFHIQVGLAEDISSLISAINRKPPSETADFIK